MLASAATCQPDRLQVQVARLPDGATFLCVARVVSQACPRWGEPAAIHVVAHASDLVYADGPDLEGAMVPIGLSCRLCDRQGCRSRAFPPLEHRLALDPLTTGASPYSFTRK